MMIEPSISQLLNESLILEEKGSSSSITVSATDSISGKSKSASALLLAAKREQKQLIEESNFISFREDIKNSYYDQIGESKIYMSPKLESSVNMKKKTKIIPNNKSKQMKMKRGEEYKDKSIEKAASKMSRKARMEILQKMY
jgi:hypothetical protein